MSSSPYQTYGDVLTTYVTYEGVNTGVGSYTELLGETQLPGPRFKGGRFAVPGATGSFSVTGVGFRPDAVVFIGSNVASEDTVVTGNNLGVFLGFMGPHYSTGALTSHAISILPEQGPRVRFRPIVMAATFNTQEYSAAAVSLDIDGFTLNFDDVGTGVVYWLAIQADGAAVIPATQTSSGTVTLGFVGKSCLVLNYRSVGEVLSGEPGGSTLHHAGYGGGGFVEGRIGEQGGGAIGLLNGAAGRRDVHTFVNAAAEYVGVGATYSGTFMSESFASGKPSGTNNLDFTYQTPNQNHARYLVWDHESVCGLVAPATGVGAIRDVSLLFNPAVQRAHAMIGKTIADSPQNSNAASNMVGLSLVAEQQDGTIFQASVFADGVASPRTFFQSPSSIVADVDGGNVFTFRVNFVAAGSGKMRWTTVRDETGGAPNLVFHAIGQPLPPPAPWIPQVYRRVLAGAGVN
jgi:hypothetical protein